MLRPTTSDRSTSQVASLPPGIDAEPPETSRLVVVPSAVTTWPPKGVRSQLILVTVALPSVRAAAIVKPVSGLVESLWIVAV